MGAELSGGLALFVYWKGGEVGVAKDKYGLTVKQRAFCDAFVAAKGNATQAAKDAGYKCKDDNVYESVGRENLGKPAIQRYLAQFEKVAEEKALMTKEEAMRVLSDLARNEEVRETDRIRAAELILRCYGAFVNNVKIDGVLPVVLAGDELVPD